MYDVLADTKVIRKVGVPSYLHNHPKSLVKHLLLLKNSVTTLMIDSMKPDHGESECNSEMDPDERESRKTLNAIISTIEERFSLRSSSIYSSSVQNYVVGFGDEYQPCWCTCPSFRMNKTLCKHFFPVINSGIIYHQSFNSTRFMSSTTTYFTIIFCMTLTTPAKKTRHKTCHFLKKMHSVREKTPTTIDGSYFALEREGVSFQES